MQQAVILAGGLGERLRPITDNIPKPLVSIGNKPFIEHVIADLRRKGINKFLLLTGYRGDLISKHFENEDTVACIRTPDNFSKSERLIHAEPYMENEFLLLYGDNLIPENLGNFNAEKSDIRFTLTVKTPGNISFSSNSRSVRYFSERSGDLNHVELGYIGVKKDPLFESLRKVDSLEKAFCFLASNNRATALVLQGPYFSISEPARLQITENAIQGKKVILIDRDGVINRRMPRGEYVTDIDKCVFLEENLKGMKELSERGFAFIIVSNQAGVARGFMSESQLKEVNEFILHKMMQSGIKILDIFTCMHGWEEDCPCRKPKPGMLLEAARKHNLFLNKTTYIGDDKRDVEAALAANCIPTFIGIETELENLQDSVICALNISLALEDIVNVYQERE